MDKHSVRVSLTVSLSSFRGPRAECRVSLFSDHFEAARTRASFVAAEKLDSDRISLICECFLSIGSQGSIVPV